MPIVGIGASAGGLDGFRRFFQAMPFDSGVAFVLIQHLDPAHESLTADLLARYTRMPVFQARDRMRVQANHIYVIPPNKYLTIAGNTLRLSEPVLDHGRRMSIDFFFHALARERREKAICIILSGTGTDGTLGLRALKAEGGLAMAQSPETAQYGGMPQSAIATGLVDHVGRVEALPEKLLHYLRHAYVQGMDTPETLVPEAPDQVRSILAVLHARTKFDFRCYKKGTLIRRIARRMAVNQIDRLSDYLSYLREHPVEVTGLFKDLLIGVTGFFREPEAFKALEEAIAPVVANKEHDSPVRVWMPGCASGEEVYSIAMTLIEQLQAAQKDCPLQLFATDIDQDALAEARAGVYPENIGADVAPERLRQFFNKKGHSFEVSKALRERVVFAPHNVIADPPFSKLDLVSCRNLLIYLQSEVQRKLIALFHFALNEGGCLFLGSAESIGSQDGLFVPCSKKWRIYRRIGGVHRNRLDFSILTGKVSRASRQGGEPPLSADPVRLAKLAQQALVQAYAPASVLVNRKHEILYYSGCSGRYLKQPSGAPTDNLLERAGEGLQHRLRSALYQAAQTRTPVGVGEVRIRNGDGAGVAEVTVWPVALPEQSEDPLFLVSFRDQPEPEAPSAASERPGSKENPLVRELEEQLTRAREELQHTREEQETYAEELRAANEEVMSVNEELRSTNEELETSKEELQSLIEELSTLNNQLQEKVSQLEASNNDLANLLVSTDIATLFLDREFRIKRYTPTTTQVLRLIAGDIGRPVSDIAHQFQDDDLVPVAGQVLERLTPHESEIRTVDGRWYQRCIRPYRTEDDRIQGVVVTFNDITVRKRSEEVLRQARETAEQANTAKTRFLAAASHDLRQPLAALTLFNAALTAKGNNPEGLEIIEKQGKALKVMGGLLESLLNLSKLEAGVLTPMLMVFPAQSLLERMLLEFEEQARAKGLTLRVRPCPYPIRSDPELLDRMLRNLLANAIEYTSAGGVLLGWRRRSRKLRLEVWDSGPGIPPDQLEEIFAEFHQSDYSIRRRRRQGLGLGLSIVKRLAELLGHALSVRSRLGRGAVFAVEVPMSSRKRSQKDSFELPKGSTKITLPPASVLLIEDNEAVLDSLRVLLETLGLTVRGASSGREVFRLAVQSSPDLIIADHRLPGETGIAGIQRIREALTRDIPAIVLTGDTSPETVKLLEGSARRVLYKPVDCAKLAALMRDLLAGSRV
ncbi:MAG: chemotaxis protein CheB [Gammaproteobacteria bacterium]